MKKWNLIVDVQRCNNCNNCLIATKDEYAGNDFPGYSAPQPDLGTLWLTVKRHERGQAPMIDVSHYVETCNHCDNPACITDKTRDAVYKRPDGIVIIDPIKAKGRKDIAGTCPYGQIFWNDELQLPQKWTFDAHLLDNGWKEPRATQVCPTEAIQAVKLTDADMTQMVENEQLTVQRPELGLKPRVYYKNYDRIEKGFIGGSLYTILDGIEDCVEGVTVRLECSDRLISETTTDIYGDFKFDGLTIDQSCYSVKVRQDGNWKSIIDSVLLDQSHFIGAVAI
ncbi:4Fe-4S dicluster domain-containing protein [Novosphingobium lubricantis]|jgi:Fe-S-cluster-containing dehydrogenase component